MKKRISFLQLVVIIILLSLFNVSPVFAHGDEARIEISPERVNPGSILDVRGVGFEPEAEVGLVLVGPQADFPLGTVVTDVEGVFQLTTTLPMELMEGAYVIHGTAEDGHIIASPELTVWGSADPGSADGEPRAEDDGLLAPMPTLAARAPTTQLATVPATVPTPSDFPSDTFLVTIAAIGIIVVSLLILKFTK